MTLEVWYWLCMALYLLVGGFGYWRAPADPGPRVWYGPAGLGIQFILFLIIGLKLFGSPVK